MRQQRVLTQHEARSDYVKPVRRSTPLPRALVLPGDSAWLHAGITLRLLHRGQLVDFFTISAMATALGPSTVKAATLPKSAPRALDERQVRQLLRAAERRGSARDQAILATMLATGLRLAEVTAWTWETWRCRPARAP